MNNKIQLKLETFGYILSKLEEWYNEERENFSGDYNERIRKHIRPDEQLELPDFYRDEMILFPFIICTASTDREKMFTLFDNFHAENPVKIRGYTRTVQFYTPQIGSDTKVYLQHENRYMAGIIEKDISENCCLHKKWFSRYTSKEKNEKIPYAVYAIIDDTIDYLKQKYPFMIYENGYDLDTIHQSHISFEHFLGKKIPKNILIEEYSCLDYKKNKKTKTKKQRMNKKLAKLKSDFIISLNTKEIDSLLHKIMERVAEMAQSNKKNEKKHEADSLIPSKFHGIYEHAVWKSGKLEITFSLYEDQKQSLQAYITTLTEEANIPLNVL
ncbi:MAG: hypothetical protein WCH65_06785 [bacterium]